MPSFEADLETVEKRLNQATRQSKLDKTLEEAVRRLQTGLIAGVQIA